MNTEPVEPNDQDILIVAHPPTKILQEGFSVQHPEDAQDLIIAGADGVVYHVKKDDWRSEATKLEDDQLPRSVQLLIALSSVMAYASSPVQPATGVKPNAPAPTSRPLAPSKSGYYLANFALLNPPDRGRTDTPEVPGVYRIPRKDWMQHRLCPGDSVFILEMLQRGTTIAYIPTTARVSNCVCYLLNLASLNGITVFEPSPPGMGCYMSDGTDGVPFVELEAKK